MPAIGWSTTALGDLAAIERYLDDIDSLVAANTVRAVRASVSRLIDFLKAANA